jgi:uncharacterized protein (TIGR03000 family)
MRLCRETLTAALVAVASTFGSTGHAQSGPWRDTGVCYEPGPPCSPPYRPPYPGFPSERVIAASATLVVHLPSDATLLVDGKRVPATGPTRYITTAPIPLGQEVVVTLRMEGRSKGGDGGSEEGDEPPRDPKDPGPKPPPGADDGSVTKQVRVRAYQTVTVQFPAHTEKE